MGRKRPHSDTTECITRSDGAPNSQIHVFFEVPNSESASWGVLSKRCIGGNPDSDGYWERALGRIDPRTTLTIGAVARNRIAGSIHPPPAPFLGW
jgi:hypothetical protein